MFRDLSNQEQEVVSGGYANPNNKGNGSENSGENGITALFKTIAGTGFGVSNSDHVAGRGAGRRIKYEEKFGIIV